MNSIPWIGMIAITAVSAITIAICIKMIEKYRRKAYGLESQLQAVYLKNDELKLKIQTMEEANAQANAITTVDAAVAELSKPRAKRSRKSTGN